MEHKMHEIKPQEVGSETPVNINNEKYWPSFKIGLEHLPEAKNWEVGQTYKLHLKVRQKSLEIRKMNENKECGEASFDILGIEIMNEKIPKKMGEMVKHYK